MRYIYIISIIFISTWSSAQNTLNGTPTDQKHGYTIGYNGFKFDHLGTQIGIEQYLATTRNFEVIGALLLQYYTQKEIQTGLGLNFRIGQRYTTSFGLLAESYIGIATEYTHFQNKVIDLTTGTHSSNKSTKFGLKPNISIGIGYDFRKLLTYPIIFFVRPNVSWLVPDRNLVFQTSINLEIGVIYRPK